MRRLYRQGIQHDIHGKHHPMRAESPMRSQPRVKRSDTLGSKNRFSMTLCKSKSMDGIPFAFSRRWMDRPHTQNPGCRSVSLHSALGYGLVGPSARSHWSKKNPQLGKYFSLTGEIKRRSQNIFRTRSTAAMKVSISSLVL